MKTLTKGQAISLEHHLSDFPQFTSFETILNLIFHNDILIDIWEPFESLETHILIDSIKALAESIDN